MTPLALLVLAAAPIQADYIVQLGHDNVSCHGTPIGIVHLLTAAHCAAETIQWQGQGLSGVAQLMWKDEKRDLAMFQVSPVPGWNLVKIAKDKPGPAEQVFYRTYLPQRVSVVAPGWYLGVDDEGDIDVGPAYLAPGGSGSGLLNSRGELIGVMKQVFNAFSIKHSAFTIQDQMQLLTQAVKFSPAAVATPVNGWPER